MQCLIRLDLQKVARLAARHGAVEINVPSGAQSATSVNLHFTNSVIRLTIPSTSSGVVLTDVESNLVLHYRSLKSFVTRLATWFTKGNNQRQ